MRLLLATDHFPPFIGGGHRWASLLSTGLAERGHEVTVATVWHGGTARVEHHGDPGVVVHRLRQLRTAVRPLVREGRQRHAPPVPDPVMARELRRVIRATKPEIVLSHGWISFSVMAALHRTRIPLVLSAHDYGYFCATRTLLHRGKPCTGPAALKCLACAGGFYGPAKGSTAVAGVASFKRLAPSRVAGLQSVTSFVDEMNSRHLLGNGPTAERVERYVIPSFVAVERGDDDQGRIEAILAQLPPAPFILFVGAIRPLKGVMVLFDAYRRLDDPPPLVLMGTIERDTPDPLPEGALLLTDVPHAAVVRAWDRALLGVVPSVWPEPLGTVAIEGISRGVPMIATMPGGMVDVLGDGAGILVPAGDAAALAGAMRSLIHDPGRREAFSRAALDKSAEFQAEAVVSRYERMLAELAARG